MQFLLFLFLTTTLHLTVAEKECKGDGCPPITTAFTIEHCKHSDVEPGTFAERIIYSTCLYQAGKMSSPLLVNTILNELTEIEPTSNYYSVGIEYTPTTRVIAGGQSHTNFDLGKYSMALNPARIGRDTSVYVHDITSKPLLIYLTQPISFKDVPSYPIGITNNVIQGNTGRYKTLFVESREVKLLEQTKETCRRYASWKGKDTLVKNPGVAVVMDPDTFCPSSVDGIDVVMAIVSFNKAYTIEAMKGTLSRNSAAISQVFPSE